MPFQRAGRIQTSSEALDRAEVEWWNIHADLIERIWGLSDVLCTAVRGDYLADIRALFQKSTGRQQLHILEIACGSGWPGRNLADAQMRVTGVDFSERQIQMAREKAVASGASNCFYRCEDVSALPELLANGAFDGAFIHCGIHHLSGDELRETARSLATVPRGTPVILVEPMYHDRRTALGSMLAKVLDAAYRTFEKWIVSGLAFDEAVEARTRALFQQSDEFSWFLSPKEMPFALDELHVAFGGAFSIEGVEVVTHYGLRMGQFLATLQDTARADALGTKWLPFFRKIDRWLIRSGWAPRLADDYFFTRIVLIRR